MSLPRNMASLRKQFYFSMFYTATSVFCFMNSTIYWFITRQQEGADGGDGGDDDAFALASSALALGAGTTVNATAAGAIPDAPCMILLLLHNN